MKIEDNEYVNKIKENLSHRSDQEKAKEEARVKINIIIANVAKGRSSPEEMAEAEGLITQWGLSALASKLKEAIEKQELEKAKEQAVKAVPEKENSISPIISKIDDYFNREDIKRSENTFDAIDNGKIVSKEELGEAIGSVMDEDDRKFRMMGIEELLEERKKFANKILTQDKDIDEEDLKLFEEIEKRVKKLGHREVRDKVAQQHIGNDHKDKNSLKKAAEAKHETLCEDIRHKHDHAEERFNDLGNRGKELLQEIKRSKSTKEEKIKALQEKDNFSKDLADIVNEVVESKKTQNVSEKQEKNHVKEALKEKSNRNNEVNDKQSRRDARKAKAALKKLPDSSKEKIENMKERFSAQQVESPTASHKDLLKNRSFKQKETGSYSR